MSERNDGWLTLAQAGQRCGLKRTQLHEYIARKDLRAEKFGPIWRISESALADFMRHPRHMGPKSKLREERVLRKLERLLERGATVTDAMKAIEVSQDRYYRESQANPAFKDRMEAARARWRLTP